MNEPLSAEDRAALRKEHRRWADATPEWEGSDYADECSQCDESWPCPMIRALEAAEAAEAAEAEIARLRQEWAAERDVVHEDLCALLEALGKHTGARPESPHVVMMECVADVRRRLA